ncbi:hypothetical protein BIV57_00385 [Mangrovactinospora gilvigrisea]|uniref:Uncharacterized protein n=1 Tax=Mangrovactinospora gilvigrisea TaxID=1428644 RepID=A0A1J7BKW6_9ACTN|nr:hypothetical protein BIV57_00385 [Mangrovactinospora gilvigrisea]
MKSLTVRQRRLELVKSAAEEASGKFVSLVPKSFVLREGFVRRPTKAPDTSGTRSLPRRRERPPAARLLSPNGIALQTYLTALLVAQNPPRGSRPGNPWPINRYPDPSWIDLVAHATAESGSPRNREVKQKQLRRALDRMRSEGLVQLPHRARAKGAFEDFRLLDDADGRDPYLPPMGGSLVSIPVNLFTHGWIHVLEDSELVFLLMVACLHARRGFGPVFATEVERRLQFGVGRDAYRAHAALRRYGLLEVEIDLMRSAQTGRTFGGTPADPGKLHRFRLRQEGFDAPAHPVVLEAVTRRIKSTTAGSDSG